jgi:hypothetical protein
MYFPWLPVEAALSIFNVWIIVRNNFYKELIKPKKPATRVNFKLSKNVCLENILALFLYNKINYTR